MDINGAVTIVTGASRGIGKVIAGDLVRRGARVAVTARSEADLKTVADSIGAFPVPADVSNEEDRQRLVKSVEAELGPIGVLVNNAGIESIRAFAEMPEADIRDIVEVNVVSTMLLTRLVLPGMLERGRGHVVNIASVAGKAIAPWNSVYSATKHALIGWTLSMRVELEGSGVGASVICPGFVAREGLFARWGDEKTGRRSGAFTTPEKVAAAVARAVERDVPEIVSSGPIGRISDVALAISPRLVYAVGKRSPAVALFRKEQERRKAEGRSRTE
jgi:short-subunit dehydrogenase